MGLGGAVLSTPWSAGIGVLVVLVTTAPLDGFQPRISPRATPDATRTMPLGQLGDPLVVRREANCIMLSAVCIRSMVSELSINPARSHSDGYLHDRWALQPTH